MRTDYKQQQFRHPNLIRLLSWIEHETGFEFIETSSHRENDNGVHGCGRGSDLRCRSLEIGLAIEAFINRVWVYDTKRPGLKCCIIHGEGRNLHIHLQVHDNTMLLGD